MKQSVAPLATGRRNDCRYSGYGASTPLLQSSDDGYPSLDRLKQILLQPPKERHIRSLQFLINFTSNIKFFVDLAKEQSEEAHLQCCQYMTHDFIRKDHVTPTQYVFHKGDSGSKFYIILEGRCSVLLPTLLETGEVEFREVMEYAAGECFGELALVMNQTRAATILCKEDTHFAVLERADFSRIIGKVTEALLSAKVDFLKSFAIFENWTRSVLQKVSYHFKERVYKRKQTVFARGDEATALYFIKDGDFQILENIPSLKSSPTLTRQKRSLQSVEVTVLTAHQIFGEEDILSGTKYRSYSVVCNSTTARVLYISKEVRAM